MAISTVNMGIGTKLSAVGVLVVVIAFWAVRKQRETIDSCEPLTSMSRKLGDLTIVAEEIEIESKRHTIGEAFNEKLSEFTRNVKNILMSPEMQDALETIDFVLDNVKKFDMEAKNYESFTFLLMALVKKAQDASEVADWQKNLPKTTQIESSQLERAQRFGEYAINVYPASWRLSMESVAKQMNIAENSIEFVHFVDHKDDGHCPKFILFLDHEVQTVVLAIRGTFSIKDVILDIVCDEVPFLDGFAHKGILNGAHRILTKIEDNQQFAILADREEKEVSQNFQKIIQAVKEARQDQFPFLQHPGQIFYLKKASVEGKEQMVYQQESQTFSGAILLLENMLTDHLQPSYQEALQNAQAKSIS